ncbi:MAG: AI-2E family transporter [Alphaproteobacteria bacterium]|nr:MAG: AI-2E family transporter [Alphaproteobacteria bacterium]
MGLTKQQQQAILLTLLLLGCAYIFLDAVRGILLPFFVGTILAYLLNPLVSYLHHRGIPRALGSAGLVAAAISLIGAGLILGLPLMIEQLASFLRRLPVYLMTLQHFVLPSKLGNLSGLLDVKLTVDNMLRPLGMIGAKGAEWTVQAMQSMVSGFAWLMNVTMLIVMTPVVAFYFLIDWPRISRATFNQLPKRWRKNTENIAKEIDVKLAAYLRGTLGVCVALGLFYAVAISGMGIVASWMAGRPVDGLELGWAIGLLTGLLTFLPVIGGTIGILLMFGVALVQYQLQMWEPYVLLGVIYMIGQFLEGYIFTPMLVGNRVGLHPLWVMFALLAGASIAGIGGMMLAIPCAVVMSVILPRALAQWRASID